MDLRHLRYFIAAVETGAIARAAVRCHIAQPSVSQAIHHLEEELGTRLLLRRRDGVQPTPSGERLYQDARRLLQDADRLRQRVLQPELTERVTVRVPPSMGGQRLAVLLRSLQACLPSVRWEVVTEAAIAPLAQRSSADSTTATALLAQRSSAENTSSAPLSLRSSADTPATLAFLPLWTETYQLLLPTDQVWPDQDEDRLALLGSLPLIERGYCEQRPVFERWLVAHAVEVRVLASVSSEDQAHALVAEGLGWTLAPLVPGEAPRGVRAVSLAGFGGVRQIPGRRLGLAVDPDWLQGELGRRLQESLNLG